jgi:hypothetical protein
MSSSIRHDPNAYLNEELKNANKRIRAIEEAAPGDVTAETLQLGDPAIKLDGIGDASIAGNLYVGGIVMEGCRVYHSSDQSIDHNTPTIINFNSEVYDTDHMHDTSTNNERVTINTPGKYYVNFCGLWQNWTTTGAWFSVRLNGSTSYSLNYVLEMKAGVVAAAFDLVAGDYLEVRVAQQCGGGSNDLQYVSAYSPYFTVQRIG